MKQGQWPQSAVTGRSLFPPGGKDFALITGDLRSRQPCEGMTDTSMIEQAARVRQKLGLSHGRVRAIAARKPHPAALIAKIEAFPGTATPVIAASCARRLQPKPCYYPADHDVHDHNNDRRSNSPQRQWIDK